MNWYFNASKWSAQKYSKREKKNVQNGSYENEKTAARASDTLARKFMANGEQGHKLNFLNDDTEVFPEEVTKTSKSSRKISLFLNFIQYLNFSCVFDVQRHPDYLR